MEPRAVKTSIPLRNEAQKPSSASIFFRASRERTSPSHIPIPSRLCDLKTKTHPWLPARVTTSHKYTRISPQSTSMDTTTDNTQQSQSQPEVPYSLIDIHPKVSFPGSTRQKAWENGDQSQTDRDEASTEKPTDNYISPGTKKTVSFSTNIPSYKRTSSVRPSSKRAPPNPESLQILNEDDFDDTDADSSLLFVTKNGFCKHQLTDTKVLEAMSTLEGALRTMQKKQQHLQEEHEKVMCEMRERHRLELSSERERLQNQILTLAKMSSSNKNESDATQKTAEVLEQRLAAKTAECCNLQAELDAKKVALESEESLEKSKATLLEAQIKSLQNQLATKDREITDLTSKLISEGSQKLRLERCFQEENQQLMADLAAAQQQNASLERKLSSASRELALSKQTQQNQVSPTGGPESLSKLVGMSQREIEHLQKLLSEERQRYVDLQEKNTHVNSKLEECQNSITELSKELTEIKQKEDDSTLEMHKGHEEVDGVTAAKDSKELQTRNAMLQADLRAAQDIQHSLERKISFLEQTVQEQPFSKSQKELEDELEKTTAALTQRESQLSEMTEKLETSVTKSPSEMSESKMSQLEAELCEARLHLDGVKKRFETQIRVNEHLKEELECTHQECAVLQDQLQLQRETAALSLNRIQQAALRKQKKLVRHIKNLQKHLKEAEAAEREVKSECLKYMAELSQQTAQLDKANDKSKLLSSELKDKRTQLRLIEDKVSQLTKTLQQQEAVQDALQTGLSQEREAHLECKAQLTERQENIRVLEAEKDELKSKLLETSATFEEEQKRSSSLEGLMIQTNQQLSDMKKTIRQRERDTHRDMEMLKTEHQNQMKATMSQTEELKSTIRNMRQREKMAKEDLERAKRSQETQREELETRLMKVDKSLAAERHKTSSLSQENRSLKMKLEDLQTKVVELTEAQKEYEDCVHKAEETKKSEIQKLFEEMAQHVQQQSDSHKYLEKLRVENEQMALQEKDKQIKELKGELAAVQQERSQEEVLIESLKFENQLMRAQLRESYSRCEVATRRDATFVTISKSQDKLPLIQQNTITHQRNTLDPYNFYT